MDLKYVIIVVTALWAGVVLGISFVAQPSKFSTPGLPRPLALATGRQMFRAMHRVESVFAMVAMVVFARSKSLPAWPLFSAVIIFVIQISLLMPPLSKRVDARLAGAPLQKSPLHAIFGIAEVSKFSLLLLATISPSIDGM